MSKRKKHSGGNPARQGLSFGLRAAARDFERWMRGSPSTLTDPVTAQARFGELLAVSGRAGFTVLDPRDTEGMVDVLLGLGPDGDDLLDVFHDYLHFRVETTPDEAWVVAHELFEDALTDGDVLPPALVAALEADALLEPSARRQALAGVLIVSRVRELLEWIGAGRAITATGSLRRADIKPVAALLNISARGVAKLPPVGEYRGGVMVVAGEAQVQSMRDVQVLTAWWDSLVTAEIIELTPTRVRAGHRAAAWLHETTPPLEAADSIVSVFVAQLLTAALQRYPDVWNTTLTNLALIQAISVLAPDEAAPDESLNAVEDMLLPRANAILTEIADTGLIVADGPRGFHVPEMLRGPFARGVILGMAFAAEVLADGDEMIDSDDDTNPFDDPAVQAEMERFGAVHAPGMAAEMLRELAPLLAEEGIDLDNLDGNDLDAVNTALARATERYNLELFTPVGEARAMALTVHRLATEALAEGSLDLARVVIDGVQPEPVGNLPSVAQVIGVGLGALDTWHRDPAGAKAVARAQVLEWDTPAMRAARDILQAARRGDAFGQLHTFHLRHGGKAVLTGTMLAVAGAAISRAADEGVDIRELVGRVLSD